MNFITISLKTQARIHTNLAVMMQQHNAKTMRAYVIWACLRTTGQRHFDRDEVIKLVMDQTGRTRQTVRGWLSAGVRSGFFIFGRKNRLSIIGKTRVFERYLQGQKPGIVCLIECDLLLTGKLAKLRAHLYGTLFVKKAMFASREILHKLSGRTKRTQLKYDRFNHQPKRYNFIVNRPEQPQTVNLYFGAPIYKTITPPPKNKKDKSEVDNRHDLYGCGQSQQLTSDNLLSVGFAHALTGSDCNNSLKGKKLFFEAREYKKRKDKEKELKRVQEKARKTAIKRFKNGLPDITFASVKLEHAPHRVRRAIKKGRYGFFTMYCGGLNCNA